MGKHISSAYKLGRAACVFITCLFLSNIVSAETDQHWFWADLVSSEPEQQASFYQQVFGWTLNETGLEDYQLFLHDGAAVAGLVTRNVDEQAQPRSHWVGIAAINPDSQWQASWKASGGKILASRQGKQPTLLLMDAAGAVLAVRPEAFPKIAKSIHSPWGWAQLYSAEPQQRADFYAELFGLQSQAYGQQYLLLSDDQQWRAAIVPRPERVERDRWVSFMAVEGLEDYLDRVRQAGGKVLATNKNIAVIADPGGALLGLYEFVFAQEVQDEN